VDMAEIIAIVGANGAGKTSLARSIVGLSVITSGRIVVSNGRTQSLNGKPTWAIAREGIVYVPETKPVFDQLTVEQNLKLSFGSFRITAAQRRDLLSRTYEKVPRLLERRKQIAGTLSGGEKRILAISKALLFMESLGMTKAGSGDILKLLILDEPTHGLHPNSISVIDKLLREVNASGVSILIVEQMVTFALSLAHRGYLMRHGEIVAQGDAKQLLSDSQLKELYLGVQ
jgi:branched-chain amino acid transport system ATP-binding protein